MNENYTKMVLALDPKLFEDWKWQDGDTFLYKEPGSIHWIEKYIGEVEVSSRNNLLYRVVDYCDTLEGEVRPLPSQKQLLKIHKDKHDTATESHSMIFFANWLEDKVKEDHGFCLFNETAEEMMLMWMQETCFDKTWNGEIWI